MKEAADGPMIFCAVKGCGDPATHALKINVPATGWAIDAHQPLTAILSMPFCEICAGRERLEDYLTEQMRKLIGAALAGRVPPDFARAWLSRIRRDSAEYLEFEKASSKGKQQ